MKIAATLFLFVVVGCTWRETIGTCVLESDFGFTLNCAFKKSGLFRVRNLGGVKGYVGLGFTVGDELGFRESLSNLESAKRRSVNAGRGNVLQYAAANGAGQVRPALPPFKPLPPGAARPIGQQPERQKLVVQQNTTASRTAQDDVYRLQQLRVQQEAKLKQQQHQQQQQQQQQKMQQEALALQMLKQQRLQQQEAMRQQQQALAMQRKRVQMNQMMGVTGSAAAKLPTIVAAIPPAGTIVDRDVVLQPASKSQPAPLLPPFLAMPQSSAQLTDRISNSPTLLVEETDNHVSKDDFKQLPLPGDDVASSVNQMTLMSLHPIEAAESSQSLPLQQTEKRQSLPANLPSLRPIQGMETSLKALAEASNVTLEALEAAILLRQKQLLQKQWASPSSTTTTTTTTTTTPPPSTTTSASQPPPSKTKYNSGPTKVMNAPREYYPMGYDKNFDDNFASRVDLPDTSFYCGDQKHFPGLYADEDLGCMVFHVCALTDDGLIMKSFLCPESTLFDQTILKCNWWFYVDCKSSKSLYDSNIPISKSYQLMKALAFFSAYKNHDSGRLPPNDENEPA